MTENTSSTEVHEYDQPFAYKHFIRITPDGGNVGRFHWSNGFILSFEYLSDNGVVIDRSDTRYWGCSSFVQTVGDWIAFAEKWP